MRRISIIGLVVLSLLQISCTNVMTEKDILIGFESGALSINEIQNVRNDSTEDLVEFITFFMNYWYGYNNDKNAVFRNYTTSSNTTSTWYYTALYVHHSQLNDVPTSQIEQLKTKAKEYDINNINVYLEIYDFFNEIDELCDSTRIKSTLLDDLTGFERFSIFNSMKAVSLTKINLLDDALITTEYILYKEMDYLRDFQRALIYGVMGDQIKCDYELHKVIENGHSQYKLEQALYLITQSQDLDNAAKILNSNNFDENVEYLLTKGLYLQALGENEIALSLFYKAFIKSNHPETLYDYLWLAISMKEFEGLDKYFSSDRYIGMPWFDAYRLVYIVEHEKNHTKAIEIFQSFNVCKRNIVKDYLIPFVEVNEILQTY